MIVEEAFMFVYYEVESECKCAELIPYECCNCSMRHMIQLQRIQDEMEQKVIARQRVNTAQQCEARAYSARAAMVAQQVIV